MILRIENALYEFLDEPGKPVQVLGIVDFRAQLDDQIATGASAKVAARGA
ncbi:hypothetical protein MKL09_00295 [Methylobacterium sp. J-048]|nr:hypothetical protein [Methylobacterium sp. J-048]MCJ2055002.1 hypothetical protein [Methylobacterium sp. J-048]